MLQLRIGTALLVAGLLVLLLAAAWLLHELGRPLNADGVPEVVRVESGRTLSQVRQELIAHGVLARRAPLVLWARLTGRDRRIQPGEYELSSAMTPREILDLLVHGRRILRRVTIPEGWNLDRILEQLSVELEIPAESLAAAAIDTSWMRAMELPVANLEGYLFPETYRFDRAPAARSVASSSSSSASVRTAAYCFSTSSSRGLAGSAASDDSNCRRSNSGRSLSGSGTAAPMSSIFTPRSRSVRIVTSWRLSSARTS